MQMIFNSSTKSNSKHVIGFSIMSLSRKGGVLDGFSKDEEGDVCSI